MKNKPLALAAMAALLATITGCGTTQPFMSPALVEQGVKTAVQFSSAQYTNTVPYLREADSIVCSLAGSTNISPTQVIAAIEASPLATQLKTKEGTLALNGALLLYIAAWNSIVGTNTVVIPSSVMPYLDATCSGMNEGLPPLPMQSKRNLPVSEIVWPLIRFP